MAGCALGDGNVHKVLRTARFENTGNPVFKQYECFTLNISHSIKQAEYFVWKSKILQKILTSNAQPKAVTWHTGSKDYTGLTFTAGSSELRKIYEGLYPNNVKTFTSEFLRVLGMQALALFWMDGGCLSFSC